MLCFEIKTGKKKIEQITYIYKFIKIIIKMVNIFNRSWIIENFINTIFIKGFLKIRHQFDLIFFLFVTIVKSIVFYEEILLFFIENVE